MDEEITQEELKQKLNNFLWQVLPDDCTMKVAEEIAVEMFNIYKKKIWPNTLFYVLKRGKA